MLGVGAIRKRERIEEYQKKARHFAHIGDVKSGLEVWREARKEFPNDWDVLCGLMYALSALDPKDKKENPDEIIEIGEKILAQCTDNQKRYSAMQVLCHLYNTLGNIEKAKEYANMAPNYYITNMILLSNILTGDELIEHCQLNIQVLTELLTQGICRCVDWGNITGDEKKRTYQMILKVFEVIYEDGDFGFYTSHIWMYYSELAHLSIEQQDKEITLDYLANAVKYAIIYDTQEDFRHTSLLVNRMWHKREYSSKSWLSNDSYRMLQNMESKCFYFCRDDERFIKLTEDLKTVAVSGLEKEE